MMKRGQPIEGGELREKGGVRKEMKTREESKKDSNRGERKKKSRARKGGKSEGRGDTKRKRRRGESHENRLQPSEQRQHPLHIYDPPGE